jgi:hypothetical protein
MERVESMGAMKVLEGANLAVRFALEMSALAAAAYWGFSIGSGVMRWALAIGAPGAVVVWALFVSPKPAIEVPEPVRLAIEFVVFGAAAAALVVTGHQGLALTFAAVALVSGTLHYVWDQRGQVARR